MLYIMCTAWLLRFKWIAFDLHVMRHSMINHCDYISFGQFNLPVFTYIDMPFGDTHVVSNTLNVKEILKIYLIEQKIYPNYQDEWYVYHSDLSHYVSDCAGRGPIITIFFLFLSDYFYVVQYTPSNAS